MGVMTFHAVVLCNDFMGALRIFRHHRLMTRGTYPVCIGGKQLAVSRGMRVMASRAVTRLYRSVHKGILKLVLKVHVAIHANFPPGPWLQL